jgi:iron-sulfur cluster assembly protein
MEFDDKVDSLDEIIETKAGLKVLIDKKSVLYLFGTELDYSDGLNGKGFHWINPNASRTCGCGESFAL